MKKRELKVVFTKGGSGSISTRISVPKTWIDSMNITESERVVVAELDGNKIIIKKKEIKISESEVLESNAIGIEAHGQIAEKVLKKYQEKENSN